MSCGRQDFDENDKLPAKNRLKTKQCVRCDNKAKVIVRVDPYCNDCFLHNFYGKLKRGVEEAKRTFRAQKKSTAADPKQPPRALVALSGGPNSRVLLDFVLPYINILNSQGEKAKSPPFATIDILHIAQDAETDQKLKSIAKDYDMKYIRVDGTNMKSGLSVNLDSPELEFSKETDAAKNLESYYNLRELDQRNLFKRLAKTATDLDYDILFTGETSTMLATKTISGMALGRGFGLGEQVGSITNFNFDNHNVLVSRPLSTSLSKEINYYIHVKKLPDIVYDHFLPAPGPKTIDSLARDFIYGLEAQFPATTSIISKTTNKLNLRSDLDKDIQRCPICGLPADTNAKDWRGANAILDFAQNSPSSNDTNTNGLARLLCYGCLCAFECEQSGKSAERNVSIDRNIAIDAQKEANRRQLGKSLFDEGLLLDDPDLLEDNL